MNDDVTYICHMSYGFSSPPLSLLFWSKQKFHHTHTQKPRPEMISTFVRRLVASLRRKKHLIPDRVGLCVRASVAKNTNGHSRNITHYTALLNYTIIFMISSATGPHTFAASAYCVQYKYRLRSCERAHLLIRT